MLFKVRAVDAAQQIHVLDIQASTQADAEELTRRQQLEPLSVDRSLFTLTSARSFDLVLFAQELLALVSAGLSVSEAIDALIENDTDSSRRFVLEKLARHLREGHRLSAAMANQPAVFPPLFVGLIEAAEGTSDLPHALTRYVAYERRLDSMRHRLVSAAVYPCILVSVGTLVTLFLLGYVVPKFAAVYQGTGRALPWASKLLMDWGAFAAANGLSLLGVLCAVVVGLIWWVRSQTAGGGWWRVLRVFPQAHERLRGLDLSRFYLTLGTLLEGGIPVARGMVLCAAVVEPAAKQRVAAARQAILDGLPLSRALQDHDLSTAIATRLIRVGEHTGQLGEMLARAAAFHDEEASRWIERFTKAFEPALMAAIGVVVGLIVILLYMPVFELAGSLQ